MERIDENVEKKTLERKITESLWHMVYQCMSYINFISNWTKVITFILYYYI